MVGVPLGRHLFTRATVCSDPINWFSRASLIANPSVLVLGKPGLGKSTLICRMCLGLDYYGYRSVVLGDLKPDYAELVAALGGNVVSLGRGQGTLNVLDPGAAVAAAERLTGRARTELVADAHGRRLNLLAALVALNRGAPLADTEEAVLSAALAVLDEHHRPGEAELADLVAVLEEGPEPLRRVTLARNDEAATEPPWTRWSCRSWRWRRGPGGDLLAPDHGQDGPRRARLRQHLPDTRDRHEAAGRRAARLLGRGLRRHRGGPAPWPKPASSRSATTSS